MYLSKDSRDALGGGIMRDGNDRTYADFGVLVLCQVNRGAGELSDHRLVKNMKT